MIPAPFKHQEEATQFAIDHNWKCAFFMEIGTGKTRSAIEAFKRLRVLHPEAKLLVIAPISLLEAAWHEDCAKFAPELKFQNLREKEHWNTGADVYVINYEWLWQAKNLNERLMALLAKNRMMACIDECFDGSTLVKTTNGEKKIKDIVPGDIVKNCLGNCRVTGTKIKKLDSWVKIKYNGRTIKCSFNHPFLTKEGWKLAHELKKGDKLVTTKYAQKILSLVREEDWSGDVSICEKGRYSSNRFKAKEAFLRNVLLGEVENVSAGNPFKNFHERNCGENFKSTQDQICQSEGSCRGEEQGEDKASLSVVSSRSQKKNIKGSSLNKVEARSSRGEWVSDANPSVKAIEDSRENVETRVPCKDRGKAALLQDRHCSTPIEISDRGRRIYPQRRESQEDGRKKDSFPHFYRVESIKVYKQAGDGKRAGCSEENLFYDLSVEHHPSFSVNGVVVHNSSKMKNHKSKTTKLLLSLRERFMWRIVMSGTPAPNSEMEYWGQMEFVQEGLLHPSFFAFRNTFFHLQNRYTGAIRQGAFISRAEAMEVFKKFEYRITDTNRARLMSRISPYCFLKKKKDCLDLPEQTDEIRLVKMGVKQARHYKEMKRDLITFINDNPRNEVMAQYAMTKTMKLREITGGFAMDDDGACHEIGETPKMDELMEVLEEAGEQQAIIWCEYRWEVERILSLLPGAVTLYGGTKDRDASISAFKSGEAKYLIAHVASAAHGLTFVNCSLEIFHSMSYSWELHEQARGRIHRAGQKNPCTYVYLICEDTIDQAILDVIRKKGSAQDLIYKTIGRA